MCRIAMLACCGVFLTALPGPGQSSWYHEGQGASVNAADELVRSWYQRYLHRTAGGGEELSFVRSLEAGQSAEQVLSAILGSTEYYTAAGGIPDRFVAALFTDLNGRPPSGPEMNYWVGRLSVAAPNDVAYEMLTRFPQHGGQQPYFPDDHRYDVRRPDHRPYKR
jgi:hypothetical protein